MFTSVASNMAAKFVVVMALVAMCNSSPILLNGVYYYRNGRGLSIGKAYSSGDGINEAVGTAVTNGGNAQAYGSATSNGAQYYRTGDNYPSRGIAQSQAQVYDAPSQIPTVIALSNPVTYDYIQPQQAAAKSSAFQNGFLGSSLSQAQTHGSGVAESSALSNQGAGIASSNARTWNTPAIIQAQPLLTEEPIIHSARSLPGKSIHWHFGTAYGTPSDIYKSIELPHYNNVPLAAAKSTANSFKYRRADSTAQTNGAGYGSANSAAMTHGAGYGTANANANVNSAGYDLTKSNVHTQGYSNANSAASTHGSGLGQAKSLANTNGYGSAQSNADVNADGYGLAKSAANTNGYGNANSLASTNSGSGLARSSANTHGAGYGSAYSNADVNNAGYGLAKSAANTHGQGSANSAAITNGAGLGSAISTARTNGLDYGAANANAHVNSADSGLTRSSANTIGSGYGSANANSVNGDGYGLAKSAANSQGFGSAVSTANTNAAGQGSVRSVANSQGYGAANANADVNPGFGQLYKYHGSSFPRTIVSIGQRTVADAKSYGLGTATSQANSQELASGYRVANSAARSTGQGSALANSINA